MSKPERRKRIEKDRQINALQSEAKDYKVPVEGGLYVLVKKAGGKYFRYKYRSPIDGKEKVLALGVYPEVSLKQARVERDRAKILIADGGDPCIERKKQKRARKVTGDTFEDIARAWHKNKLPEWSENHAGKTIRSLENHLFPLIGDLPIKSIQPGDVLGPLKNLAECGDASGKVVGTGKTDTAGRLLERIAAIFRYAIANQKADRDVTFGLRDGLPVHQKKHLPAIVDPARVARLLILIDGYRGTATVIAALKLSPLVFQRPGEIRLMEWSHVNLEDAEWRIPGAEHSKIKSDHSIPLSRQAVAILQQQKLISRGSKYVFPGYANLHRPMSDAAVRDAIHRLGIGKDEMCAHGFRTLARTIMDEEMEIPVDWVEQQLAHSPKDPLGRAYNRTKHLKQRREMLQQWADYLDQLKADAKSREQKDEVENIVNS